jgi:RNA polymerase sigma-70 factor, ECF subfamily
MDNVDQRSLCVKWKSTLLAIARRGVPTEDDAEDVLQTFFAEFLRKPNLNINEGNAEPYLFRCITNAVAEWWRKRYGQQNLIEVFNDQDAPLQALNPREEAQMQEDQDRLRMQIIQLPKRQSEAVMLRYFADLSTREVSQAMDCEEATVRSFLRHAISTLKETAKESNTILSMEDYHERSA